LLHGIPRIERRWGRSVQQGWVFPPISAAELQSWSAFERVHGPILAHERLEVSNGIVAMTLASMFSDGKRRLKLADFMPRWDSKATADRQSPEEMIAAIESHAGRNLDD
jgi:hypothetical protein